VGNYPQAFSHVSLVNASYNLTGHPDIDETARPTMSVLAAMSPMRLRQFRRSTREPRGSGPGRRRRTAR